MYLLPVAKTRQVPSTVEPSTNTNVFSPEQLTIPLEKYYALIRLNRKNIYCNNEFERKKDIFESEQLYRFLYSISEFEKKHQQLKRRKSDNLYGLSDEEEDSVLSRSSKYGNTFIFEDLE